MILSTTPVGFALTLALARIAPLGWEYALKSAARSRANRLKRHRAQMALFRGES